LLQRGHVIIRQNARDSWVTLRYRR
jgi:hypothetical protein